MRRMLRAGRIFGLFANNRTIVQLPRHGHCDAVAGIQTFSDFEAPAALVFGLAGRTDLVFRNLIAVQQENFINAVTIIDGGFRQENRLLLFLTRHGGLHEKPRLQPPIRIDQQSFGVKSARVQRNRRINSRNLPMKRLIGKRFDP